MGLFGALAISTVFQQISLFAEESFDSDILLLANMQRSSRHSGLPRLNYSEPSNARHLNEIQLMHLYRSYMIAEINRQPRKIETCLQNRQAKTVMCPTARNPRNPVASCIDIKRLCSGQPECPGSEDEHPIECMFYKAIEEQIQVLKLKVTDFVVSEIRRRRQGN